MFKSLAEEMHFARDLALSQGKIMEQVFFGKPMKSSKKFDGTDITDITPTDQLISDNVVEAYRRRNIRVAGEEKGCTAKYEDHNVMMLDPIDGTNDFIAGNKARAKVSSAMFSLALMRHVAVMGVTFAPMLKQPTLFMAYEGGGAYKEINGVRKRLYIDTEPTRGIVLVSRKARASSDRLQQMGFQVIPLGGAVFKASALVDPSIVNQYKSHTIAKDVPIVGFLSTTTYLHDFAASGCIVKGAGGIAESLSDCQSTVAASNSWCGGRFLVNGLPLARPDNSGRGDTFAWDSANGGSLDWQANTLAQVYRAKCPESNRSCTYTVQLQSRLENGASSLWLDDLTLSVDVTEGDVMVTNGATTP